MDIQKAWQTVLDQLEIEMPRASFDTWVRDTQAVSYEDGRLAIGVRNAYARDWLESRLASTVSRLLIGIMNRTVDVDFLLSQPDLEDNDFDSERDTEERGKGQQEIDLAASTRYEEEVKPHRIVMFPGYALRLLEQGDLNAKEMSLWVAFRQAVYVTHKKTGSKRISQNIPHQEIINFANMSKPSFFRAIAGEKKSLSAGLIRRLPDQSISTGNPYFDNAIRWEISLSPRLTKHDATVIARLLEADISLAEIPEERQRLALDALQRMTATHPAEWLESVNVNTPKSSPPRVKTILRSVLGIEHDIPEKLFEAAEALENRLMSAFGKVVITHHFLQVVAPSLNLTQAQMWTIISLRDHRYYDHENRAQYDYILAEDGVKTLAKWSGVSLKSFGRWIDDPVFGTLLQKVDVKVGENEHIDRLITGGGEVYHLRGDEPPLWFEEEGDILIPHWTKRDTRLDKVITASGQSDNRSWTKRYTDWDKVITGLGQSDNPLNNLIKPLNPHKPHKALPTTPEKDKSSRTSPSAQGGGGWELSSLLMLNPVSDKKIKERILKKGDAIAFVSWILYGYSREGKGVISPSSLAISNLAKNPDQGARASYMRIAQLGPDILSDEISSFSQPYNRFFDEATGDTGFGFAFKDVPTDRLVELASCLFEQPPDI